MAPTSNPISRAVSLRTALSLLLVRTGGSSNAVFKTSFAALVNGMS